jgi:dihydrofolate reductase
LGKLIYLMNVSLDGFVETPDRSLDWTMVDEELHSWFNERTRGHQAALYGRRMWEVMGGHWPTGESDPAATDAMREFARVWNAMPKIVFSTSLEHIDHNARLVRGDVGDVLADLRREFDGDLEVSGPTLAGQFVRRGLVDEYQLVVHPVAIGAGRPYWPDVEAPLRLRPAERHTFTSGVELRTYLPA